MDANPGDARLDSTAGDHLADLRVVKVSTLERGEEPRAAWSNSLPSVERFDGDSIDPDDAILATLALVDADLSFVEVDIAHFQVKSLGATEARAVENADQSTVTDAGRVARIGLVKKGTYFVPSEPLWELFRCHFLTYVLTGPPFLAISDDVLTVSILIVRLSHHPLGPTPKT